MQSFGLELPSPTYIFGAIVFGLIGLVAFRRGRRAGQRTTLWLGVALMVYPYAISRTWLLYAVGVALCTGIYLDHRG
jgi:apolipoprotein N-acyltransferase